MWLIITVILGVIGALLNRLRGGWFKELTDGGKQWWNGSVASKLVWAIPTGLLLFFLTTPDTNFWYRSILLVISSFAAWALFGSGAHSIMNKYMWIRMWATGSKAEDYENFTFWLPLVMSPPTRYSSEEYFWQYHIIGKSTEGVVRMFVTILPICILAPAESLWIVLSGVAWGPLYWASWQVSDTRGWPIGELLTGGWTWLIIATAFLVL